MDPINLRLEALRALIWHDLVRAVSTGGLWLALAFFLLTILLAPFAIGPDTDLLARIGAALVWIAALLALLMTLDRLFQIDLESGALDLIAKSVLGLEWAVPAKIVAHWLAVGVPLILLSPVAGALLGLTSAASAHLMVALLVGTPGLSAAGAIAAALTAGLRRGGLLVGLLVLPLAVPFIIFGAGASFVRTEVGLENLALANLQFLGAASLVSIALALVTCPLGLRSQLD